MNIKDSFISVFTNWLNFSGRACRSEYWYFVLFYAVVGGVTEYFVPTISAIFILAIFIPAAAAGCRRMHDVGRSGWFQLIPLVNLVWLCEQSDNSATNKF